MRYPTLTLLWLHRAYIDRCLKLVNGSVVTYKVRVEYFAVLINNVTKFIIVIGVEHIVWIQRDICLGMTLKIQVYVRVWGPVNSTRIIVRFR